MKDPHPRVAGKARGRNRGGPAAVRSAARPRPVRELDHTADLGIELEAGTPAELFRRAGLALYALMVAPVGVEGRSGITVRVTADDWTSLLHDWLSALLRRFLIEGFVARSITVDRITQTEVVSTLSGERLDWNRHQFLTEIKGVTWHEISVEPRKGRWYGRVIFDV